MVYLGERINVIHFKVFSCSAIHTWPVLIKPRIAALLVPLSLILTLKFRIFVRHTLPG